MNKKYNGKYNPIEKVFSTTKKTMEPRRIIEQIK